MADLLLDYKLNSLSVSNKDGSFPITFANATVVPGPGVTPIGQFDQALDFGSTGKGAVDVSALKVDTSRFTLRVLFQAKGPVVARQNLIESNWLPFSLYLLPGKAAGEVVLVSSVATKAHGWNGPTTKFITTQLKQGIWYRVDLVYDNDTAGLFIDGEIVSVHAFPLGTIQLMSGKQLFVGSWVDGTRDHFGGLIAAIQWYTDIPAELESRLDESRSQAEWFTTYKYEAIKPKVNLGNPQSAPIFDTATQAYLQSYDAGAIMYHDGVGAAFEMHGAIYGFYKSWTGKASIGYLVSDEGNTTQSGGRKNIFSKGGIYWAPATGAIPVIGQIYLDYESMGESSAIGFPAKVQAGIAGGLEQEFQGGRMYLKNGTSSAFEVHGAILAKFLATGGVNKWGYPITNETSILKNGAVVGKFSEFENCTIYWSGSTGAFEVHGDIRKKYKDICGPIGELGFPVSDEGDIPGVAGAGRYNCFQNGSILWYGSFSSIIIARSFHVYLGRVNSKESEGFAMGQNDLYMRVTLDVDGTRVYNQRHPSSGDFSGQNIVDLNVNIPNHVLPNSPSRVVRFGMDIWESDSGAPFGEGDDHLGVYSHELNMANGWGLRENQGIFNSGAFSMINNISWSVKPDVDPASLTETQKFWGQNAYNRGTDQLSYAQYASAFRDVDSETEWWDLIDWLEKAFYELVVKGIAKGGNCFGMSLEAIYSRKDMGKFGLPIDRFDNWATVVNEFNIKQAYQVGAAPIWWFVGEFLSGNTHDPKAVFTETFREFSRGNHPVLCIAQNYDFSGAPHCILPVAWDSSSKPWKITICDPNYPQTLKVLTVDPDHNTFEYISSASRVYRGGEWSGGRLHYMPFCKVNTRPRTPIWDAIALLLAGTILILGEDAETTSITDLNGNDLNAFSEGATNQLKAVNHLDNYFVPAKGWGGTKGSISGEVLMRQQPASQFTAVTPSVGQSAAVHLALGDMMRTTAGNTLAVAMRDQATVLRSIQDRRAHFVVNDAATMAKLTPAAQDLIRKIATAPNSTDFRHNTRGLRNGSFAYAAKQVLSEFRVQSDIQSGEQHAMQVNDFGSSKSIVSLRTDRSKLTTVQIANQLGVKNDQLKITIENLPVEARKELLLNIRPGMGGFDLLTANQPATVTVTCDAIIDGKKITRKFGMPLEGGIRLKTSQLLSDTSINVSRIDKLFGSVTGSRKLKIT